MYAIPVMGILPISCFDGMPEKPQLPPLWSFWKALFS